MGQQALGLQVSRIDNADFPDVQPRQVGYEVAAYAPRTDHHNAKAIQGFFHRRRRADELRQPRVARGTDRRRSTEVWRGLEFLPGGRVGV
jgi:hypothetical protein